MTELTGCRVAVLATDGFEQLELTEPVRALRAANAQVTVIAPRPGEIQGMTHHDKAEKIGVDRTLAEATPDDFDALVLPGGVANPDELRTIREAVAFVQAFAAAGKPIAAICHAPWTLIEADAVRGRRMTSWPSLRTDLRNAGALWEDAAVVVDGALVTSRKPDDLRDFCREMLHVFAAAGAA